MRVAGKCFFVCCCLAGVVSAPVLGQNVTVSLEPASATAAPGDTVVFEVRIVADGADLDLRGYQIGTDCEQACLTTCVGTLGTPDVIEVDTGCPGVSGLDWGMCSCAVCVDLGCPGGNTNCGFCIGDGGQCDPAVPCDVDLDCFGDPCLGDPNPGDGTPEGFCSIRGARYGFGALCTGVVSDGVSYHLAYMEFVVPDPAEGTFGIEFSGIGVDSFLRNPGDCTGGFCVGGVNDGNVCVTGLDCEPVTATWLGAELTVQTGEPCSDCFPCDDDDACTKDLCDTGAGICEPSCQIAFGDANDNGVTNTADVLQCNGSISGGLCANPACDVNPVCTGNGVINTGDVLTINGSIGQPDPCNCPPRDCP